MLLYLFDLVGVFAFAFAGARSAKNHAYHSAGIAACAFLTALGGGTIRSLLIGHQPIYFTDPSYGIVVAVGIGASLLLYQRYAAVQPLVRLFDTIGVITFAYIGAAAALTAGLGAAGAIAFAILTAYGGGILSDLLTRTKPQVLGKPSLYLLPVILTAIACWLAASMANGGSLAALLIGVAFGSQLAIAYVSPQLLHRALTPHYLVPLLYAQRTAMPENE